MLIFNIAATPTAAENREESEEGKSELLRFDYKDLEHVLTTKTDKYF